MKVSKAQLILWAQNIRTDSVDVEIECFGGGTSTEPNRYVMGYNAKFSIVEEAHYTDKPGIDELK